MIRSVVLTSSVFLRKWHFFADRNLKDTRKSHGFFKMLKFSAKCFQYNFEKCVVVELRPMGFFWKRNSIQFWLALFLKTYFSHSINSNIYTGNRPVDWSTSKDRSTGKRSVDRSKILTGTGSRSNSLNRICRFVENCTENLFLTWSLNDENWLRYQQNTETAICPESPSLRKYDVSQIFTFHYLRKPFCNAITK
jgi:hypothetical protein